MIFAICILASYLTKKPIKVLANTNTTSIDAEPTFEKNIPIKFSIVVTATSKSPEAAMFEGGRWLHSRKMAHSVVAICHPKGLLLLDTGLGKNIDNEFVDMPFLSRSLISYEDLEPIADQLDGSTFCPGRQMQIVLSHLHWDHASGIEDFPHATIWVGPNELTSAKTSGAQKGYIKAQFDNPDIKWKTITYTSKPYLNYELSFDFFDDGAVVLVPMKGHSKGSVGLFLNMGKNKNYFFTGDTTWSLEGFELPAHKHALMRPMVDEDVSILEEEILRVHALMNLKPSIAVVPAHYHKNYPQAAIYPKVVQSQ